MTVDRIPVHRFTAINSLQPNARFLGASDQVTVWKTPDIPQPTEEQIQAEITRLTNEYNAAKYQRDRSVAYDPIKEQLDQLYWDKKNGTNKWVEAIDKVKSDNPKP